MSTLPNNVTRISSNSVYIHIQSFLRNKGLKSKNTQREYETDVRNFFSYMTNKSLEELTPSDLKFNNSSIMDYQLYLSEDYKSTSGESYKNSTVNRKLASIASLYEFLKRNDYDVNPNAMKVDPLPDDSTSHGILQISEANQMAELALTEREKGATKRLLILLALRTSLRKEALLNLKWSDIQPDPDNTDVYTIQVSDNKRQDKGKKISKEISAKMYNELLSIKVEGEDKIFNISGKYVNEMIRRLVKKMGIPEERNIVFHSLKKTGINFVYEITNDIYAASSQAGHSSINTTASHYMKRQKNLAGTMMDSDVSIDIFKSLTHEECISLLQGVENGLGLILRNKANELINSRPPSLKSKS